MILCFRLLLERHLSPSLLISPSLRLICRSPFACLLPPFIHSASYASTLIVSPASHPCPLSTRHHPIFLLPSSFTLLLHFFILSFSPLSIAAFFLCFAFAIRLSFGAMLCAMSLPSHVSSAFRLILPSCLSPPFFPSACLPSPLLPSAFLLRLIIFTSFVLL